ncbi:hypothetical protein BD626DRAFT_630492 [Schizophyllum amplum]|uniref:SMP-30/Gluconolactonase/LRE-like region domain-containing protein n=1 Tax=Schizophyllum amplum TaxID=97359 RepID=A0A550CDG7_9AGAR|nr:hypothetical protein BD626DRAFT_630492 [Auriculariopsis ampla]
MVRHEQQQLLPAFSTLALHPSILSLIQRLRTVLMMTSRISLAALFGIASLAICKAPVFFYGRNSTPTIHEVYTFPVNTSVENLAVRPGGEVLATVDSAPELYQIIPFSSEQPTLVYDFPGYESLLGIVEVEEDQFYVAAGNFSVFTLESTKGSYAIFHVDMSSFRATRGTVQSQAVIKKVTDIPEGELLNGLGLFSREKGLVYVADSGTGIIYLVNVRTGAYWPAIHDALGVKGDPYPFYPAVNGVRYDPRGRAVYFTNVAQAVFARVPVFANGSAAGAGEIIASGELYDDFVLDEAGNALVAVFGSSDVIRIDAATGESMIIAGSLNSTDLQAATAVAWGRTRRDSHSLYVSRNGGIGWPSAVGGAVMRIDMY